MTMKSAIGDIGFITLYFFLLIGWIVPFIYVIGRIYDPTVLLAFSILMMWMLILHKSESLGDSIFKKEGREK